MVPAGATYIMLQFAQKIVYDEKSAGHGISDNANFMKQRITKRHLCISYKAN